MVLLIKMPFPPIPANKDRCLGESQTGAYYLGAGEKTGVSWYWQHLMEDLEGQLVIPMLETTGLGSWSYIARFFMWVLMNKFNQNDSSITHAQKI